MQQYVAYVNTGKSKLEIFRMAEELEVGESESLEKSWCGCED